MRIFGWGLAVVALVLVQLPADAAAQNRKTRDRLEEIEKQLQDLQGVVFGEEGVPGAAVRFEGANPNPSQARGAPADSSIRVGQLEEQVQQLTGRIEELQYQINQQQQQMERLISLAYPEYEGDTGLGSVSGGRVPINEGVSAPVDLVGGVVSSAGSFGTAESAYAAGRSALREARYADAEKAFLTVVDDFSSSNRAGDASYYLGETYLAQGDLGGSARTFLDFIRNYPESELAPDAHLKLGQAFARADKTREACRVWLRALQTYDDMESTLKSRITDMREATCS